MAAASAAFRFTTTMAGRSFLHPELRLARVCTGKTRSGIHGPHGHHRDPSSRAYDWRGRLRTLTMTDLPTGFVAGVHECHGSKHRGQGRRISKTAGNYVPRVGQWRRRGSTTTRRIAGSVRGQLLDGSGTRNRSIARHVGTLSGLCKSAPNTDGTANRLYRNPVAPLPGCLRASGNGVNIGKGMSVGPWPTTTATAARMYGTTNTEANFLFHTLGGKKFE